MMKASPDGNAQFSRTPDGWLFRACGWIAPCPKPWILSAPWTSELYLLDDTQKADVEHILRAYLHFLMGCWLGAMFAAIGPFLLALWGFGMGNLSPAGFAVAFSLLWGSFSLALAIFFVALGIDRYRTELAITLGRAEQIA